MKEEIIKIEEVCRKIKDIENRRMEIASNNNEVYDPAIMSWVQIIESIVIDLEAQREDLLKKIEKKEWAKMWAFKKGINKREREIRMAFIEAHNQALEDIKNLIK